MSEPTGRAIRVLAGEFAICRLGPSEEIPPWARGPGLVAAVRTDDHLTVVCGWDRVPDGVRRSGPWSALAVNGPMELTEVGVIAAIAAPLAAAGVSLFAVSTFDTDVVLVPADRLAAAVEALRGAGHRLDAPPIA